LSARSPRAGALVCAAIAVGAFVSARAATPPPKPADENTLRLSQGGPARVMPSFVQVTTLGDSVYALSAGTANVTACLTDSGWVLVDTGTRIEAAAIRERVRLIAQRPFVLVVDTHMHDDHAGGNALYEGMGVPVWATARTVALAKDRARRVREGAPKEIARLEAYRASLPKGAASARVDGFASFFADWWREALEDVRKEPLCVRPPDHGFRQARLVRRFGGTTVEVIAMPRAAHTGGDCVVLFRERKVAAVGDVFAKGSAPWADQFMADGSLEGILAAQDSLIALLPADSTWRIVPGHGPTASPLDLIANRRALAELRACTRQAFDAGRPRASTGEDCAGVGFGAEQGTYASWLFYEDWTRARSKPAHPAASHARPVDKSLTNE
jgi:glyoxylase-like metal-dependent hydrolase (beta-lactamase superfamily II)